MRGGAGPFFLLFAAISLPAQQNQKWDYQPEDLWAFQPLRPAPANATVDSLLGRKPAPPADRAALIRRATFDLTGLPPTPDEIASFVNDSSPDAFRNLVERLLASPRYGERWGRHWLDVVRYADSDGYSNDYERPNAWRYRDYVIRSFNQDKPYDRFVIEQIAGDELDPSNPENLVATGFLRMGPWEHTSMSVAAVTRQAFLDDVTHSVGTTFLGLTVGCARCHDHKFDPIPTRDYYRLQAVFATAEFEQRPAPFLAAENTAGFEQDSARVAELIRRTQARIAEFKGRKLDPPDLERERAYRKRVELYRREADRYRALAFSVRENRPAPPMFILTGGSLGSPGQAVTPGTLSVVGRFQEAARGEVGSRLELARWITGPARALAARVMVNRIWQYHFGEGLAATPNNFGKMGKKPTHPELLDWLADGFIASGWSIKEMHRVMMLSAAYQSSDLTPRRLDAEELRDSILAVSGELSRDAGGPGTFPDINEDLAQQPILIMGTIAPAYQPSPLRRQRNRRTIYTFQKRSLVNPVIEVFNGPSLNESCERRQSTTVPSQVFALLNSKFAHDAALAFAARLEKLNVDPGRQVDHAFRLAFGRSPDARERRRALEHVVKMTELHRRVPLPELAARKPLARTLIGEYTGKPFDLAEESDPVDYEENLRPDQVSPGTRALADLALVLFNSNEFIYVY